MTTASRGPRIAIDCRKIADYGIGTYVRNLVRELAALDGDEEYVLIVRPDGTTLPPSPRLRVVTDDSPHYSMRELFSIARIIDREDVDLFHAPHYVVPFTRRPTVVTIHDLIHLRAPASTLPFGARFYARWMIRRATRKAHTVIVPTDAVREDLQAAFPGLANEVATIPLGVDPVFLGESDVTARGVLARCGLEGHRFVLYAGNDKPHKNLDRLLAAWRIAQTELHGVRLVLAGASDDRVIDAEGVIRTGWVSTAELAALVGAARALVQPSLLEGFGLPVVEAMACGTPVIVSDIPALAEVSGDAAIRIDPLSAQSIASAFVTLINDDVLHARLSASGRERAARFSWASTARTTLAVYHRALKMPSEK